MMAEAVKTIEQMIAEWYASGVRSDECFHEITRQMEPIARSVTRGYDRRLVDEVCSGAVGHVVTALQSDVNQGVPGKSYDPTRPFAAWCYTVVERYAISEWRRQWHKRTKNTPPTQRATTSWIVLVTTRLAPRSPLSCGKHRNRCEQSLSAF